MRVGAEKPRLDSDLQRGTENKRAGVRRRLFAYCVVKEDCYYCVLTILSSAVRATSAESLLSMPIDFTSLHVPLT